MNINSLVKRKNLIFGTLGFSSLVFIYWLYSRKKESNKNKDIEFENILSLLPEKLKIQKDGNFLSSKTIQEIYLIVLNLISPKVIDFTNAYRIERRENFDIPRNYLINFETYNENMSRFLFTRIKEILEDKNIDESYWIESIDYHIRKGDKKIEHLVKNWLSYFMKEKWTMKQNIDLQHYKKILEIFFLVFENQNHCIALFSKWNISNEDLAKIRFIRIWDEVHKKIGFEEEDLYLNKFQLDTEGQLLKERFNQIIDDSMGKSHFYSLQ